MITRISIGILILFISAFARPTHAQILQNSDFTEGTTGWTVLNHQGATSQHQVIDGTFSIDISNPGTARWHIQLVQSGLTITQGEWYSVSITASASEKRTIDLIIGENGDNYEDYQRREYALTNEMQTYNFIFKMNRNTDTDARFVVSMGNESPGVEIEQVTLALASSDELPGIQESPFSKGVNLPVWFQQSSAQQVFFGYYKKKDFEDIKSLGADVIRLPVRFHDMTSGAPDYTVDPLLFYFLDQVVDWAEELDLHLIFDNHSWRPDVPTSPDIDDALIPVWRQVAEHFKDDYEHLYFEILNEPHGISASRWGEIQGDAITAIREVNQRHTIIVGGNHFNSFNSLQNLPEYEDDNLIYTFHFYEPFIFTHQGASWTDPSLVPLSGVPFPYDASSMPDVPDELEGTWVEQNFTHYEENGTVKQLKESINVATYFAQIRGVPIFCGEFGVFKPNSNNSDRVFWYGEVAKYLNEQSISWTTWDYRGGFGLFEKDTDELFEHDLNIPLLEALGFNTPEQTDFEITPDTNGFSLFLDTYGEHIYNASRIQNSTLSYYESDLVHSGSFSISWSDAGQYDAIGFDFKPNRDFSYLANNEYVVDFMVKTDANDISFDLRFTDTDTPNDHPWRMTYRIDEHILDKTGSWQRITILLSSFTEQGSWDDEQWFSPQGDFDWTAIDQFSIVAEEASLEGVSLWFDEIQIVHEEATANEQDRSIQPTEFKLFQNYPNPFNPATTIQYELAAASHTRLTIYNILGQEVAILVDEQQHPGYHSVRYDASHLSSGIYIYELRSGDNFTQETMTLIK